MGKTVLVVDDDLLMRGLIVETLESTGFSVRVCDSLKEAVAYIGEADILITDFQMQGINGAELAKIAKLQRPDLPVLLVTRIPYKVPAGHLADMILAKPFSPRGIISSINFLLEEK